MREYFGVRRVFLVSSGTAALTVALQALRSLSRRTEVVLPAYTCPSVPAAVLAAGLRPVLVDVNPETLDYEYGRLSRAIGDDTLAVIAHHPFGVAANVDRIRSLCRRHGAFVVEDAAQAMGVRAGGRRLGTMGDIGIFSLGRGKSITSGSGGVVVTSSEAIGRELAAVHDRLPDATFADTLTQLAVLAGMAIFLHPRLYWLPAGLPFLKLGQTLFPRQVSLKRLSGLQAGFLRHWRERLEEANRGRAAMVDRFHRAFGLADRPSPPYSRLPIVVANADERDRLYRIASARGLGLSIGYPRPINEFAEVRALFDGQTFPGASRLAACLLTLPTHRHVSGSDQQALVACLRTSVGARTPSREWRKAS
jgi:dTDP-4-amino-4,6-dideoxygalactose transaminase